jgi:hypothetical protein
MAISTRRQLTALGVLLVVYAALAFVYYLSAPLDQFLPPESLPSEATTLPRWALGLANASLILVVYGLIGLAGYWFATKVGLPRVYREDAGSRDWFVLPLLYGLVLGVVLVVADRFFASMSDGLEFPHPAFPFSLIASATAAIGEEILYRFFVMGVWAFLLGLITRRWGGAQAALWIANVVAALAFAAGHLPAAMLMFGIANPAGLPTPLLIELFLLNGIVGFVAGVQYMRTGLVAAIGFHFWTDFVWHAVWPLVYELRQ